jgi:hypothetical protein
LLAIQSYSNKTIYNIANLTFTIYCGISVVLLNSLSFPANALGRKKQNTWVNITERLLQVQVTLALILLTAGVGMPIGW